MEGKEERLSPQRKLRSTNPGPFPAEPVSGLMRTKPQFTGLKPSYANKN